MTSTRESAVDRQNLMKAWRAAGGTTHGPNAEHVSMPLDKFWDFMEIAARAVENAAQTAPPTPWRPASKAPLDRWVVTDILGDFGARRRGILRAGDEHNLPGWYSTNEMGSCRLSPEPTMWVSDPASPVPPAASEVADDNPDHDATDAAHPAWWRGNDAGVEAVVRIANTALDGLDDLKGVSGSATLYALRHRLAALASTRGGQGTGECSAENEAEHFIQAAIDTAPEPLRRLGRYLADVLDEDQFKTAERILLGGLVNLASQPDPSAREALAAEAKAVAATFEGWFGDLPSSLREAMTDAARLLRALTPAPGLPASAQPKGA